MFQFFLHFLFLVSSFVSSLLLRQLLPYPLQTSLSLPMSFLLFDKVDFGFNTISLGTMMVKRSFDVCGITTNNKSKVRNGDFYNSCMENANKHLQDDDDDAQDDPFVL